VELLRLAVVENRWHALTEGDGVPQGRMTEFPAWMPLADVIWEMKRRSPWLLIRGTAMGIPQPDPKHPEQYMILRGRLDRREALGPFGF
jgi:hypothetical protein